MRERGAAAAARERSSPSPARPRRRPRAPARGQEGVVGGRAPADPSLARPPPRPRLAAAASKAERASASPPSSPARVYAQSDRPPPPPPPFLRRTYSGCPFWLSGPSQKVRLLRARPAPPPQPRTTSRGSLLKKKKKLSRLFRVTPDPVILARVRAPFGLFIDPLCHGVTL